MKVMKSQACGTHLNLSTGEVDARRIMSSRPAWAIQQDCVSKKSIEYSDKKRNQIIRKGKQKLKELLRS
jgi:hypothetical protein